MPDTGVSFAESIPLPLDQYSRLILVAPRLRNRHIVLARLLHSVPDAYFYALRPDQHTLSLFLSGLVEEHRAIDPVFGSALLQTLQKSGPHAALTERTANAWARALLSDLSNAQPTFRHLVLDCFDYLVLDNGAIAVLEYVAQHLKPDQHIIINSRRLIIQPWSRFVQDGLATVLGSEDVPGGGLVVTGDDPDLPHVEIYNLSGGTVLVNGLPVTDWGGALPRVLLYYLIDHADGVTRDKPFATFWPQFSRSEGTNMFHGTKSKLNQRIGRELTSYQRGFYRLSEHIRVHYDVAQFEGLVQHANSVPLAEGLTAWTEAVHVYRTPFLRQFNSPWIRLRREQLQRYYAEALIQVGRWHQTQGQAKLAISFYLRVLRETPYREDIHRAVIELYHAAGHPPKHLLNMSICEIDFGKD